MARIVVAGAGALGSVYGGLLAVAGFDVVFLAHGAHAEALRRGPLTVELPTRTDRVRVRVEHEVEADILLLTAKAFDTDPVLEHVHGEPQLAVSFQNGLAKNEPLRRRFGADTVVGGVSTVAAELPAPGLVRSANLGMTFVGRPEGTTRDRVPLAATIAAAGLPVEIVDDIAAVEWSKLAQVAAVMAAQAITGLYVHEVLITPPAAALVKRILEEVDALADSVGVKLTDRGAPFPLVNVARASHDEGVELLRIAGERMRERGATTMRTSMLQSLEAGKRTELEAIHGEIVRRAGMHDVPIPATALCYRLVRRREGHGRQRQGTPDRACGSRAAVRVLAALERRGDTFGGPQEEPGSSA